ncbi:WD domain, G-beta repeat-containing protein [Toxoplasma gondii ARI]|uniref:WD domain, G-beta repeat-containing protein n=1 Tax=Toxoplasma gondii ARI TaxID=1074872 RepID=A0A139XPH8_TOXGO|nr:WD domain, G-beta repeat-containing protein [Toxoplasma gondii ARI]
MPWQRSFISSSLAASESPDRFGREFLSAPLHALAFRCPPPASVSDENLSPRGAKSEDEAAGGTLCRAALVSPRVTSLLSDAQLDACRHGLASRTRSSSTLHRAISTPPRNLRRAGDSHLVRAQLPNPPDCAWFGLGEKEKTEKARPRWSALDVLLSEDVLRYVLAYCGPREAAALAAVSPVCRGAMTVASLDPLWYTWWLDRQFHFWPHTQVPPDVLPCSQPLKVEDAGCESPDGGASRKPSGAAGETVTPRCRDADLAARSARDSKPSNAASGADSVPPRGSGCPGSSAELRAEGDFFRSSFLENGLPVHLLGRTPKSPFITGNLEIEGWPPSTPPLILGLGPHSGLWRRQFLWSVRTLHNWATGRCQRFQVPSSDHSLLSVALHPSYQSPLCSCRAVQSVFSAELQRRRSRRSSFVSERRASRAGSTAREVSELACGPCNGEVGPVSPDVPRERSTSLSRLPPSAITQGELSDPQEALRHHPPPCFDLVEDSARDLSGTRSQGPGFCGAEVQRDDNFRASFGEAPVSTRRRSGGSARRGVSAKEEFGEAWGEGRMDLNDEQEFPASVGFTFEPRFFSVHEGLDAVLEQRSCFFTASADRVAVYEHAKSCSAPLSARQEKEPTRLKERQSRSQALSPSLGPRAQPDVHSTFLNSPALTPVLAPASKSRERTISDLDSYEIYLWNQTGCAPNNVKNRTSGAGSLGSREAADFGSARGLSSSSEAFSGQAIGLSACAAGSQGANVRRGKTRSKKPSGSGRKPCPGFPESPSLSPVEAMNERERPRSCSSPPPFALEPALNPVPDSEEGPGDRSESRRKARLLAADGGFGDTPGDQGREKGSERTWKEFSLPQGGLPSRSAHAEGSQKHRGDRGCSMPSTPACMRPLSACSRPPVHELSRFARGSATLLSCRIHTETGRMACTIGTAAVMETAGETRVGGRRRRKCGSVGGATGAASVCEGRVYDLHSGQLVCSLDIDGNGLHPLQFRYAFSDDAGLLFGFDRWHREFVCWNLASLYEGQISLDAAAIIAAHADGILAMDAAGCGPGIHSATGDCRVLVGSRDDTISLYAADPFVRLQTFSGHEGEVSAVCWLARTPCNEEAASGCLCSRRQQTTVFASGAYDALVKIWDVRQKPSAGVHRDRQLTLLEHHSRISSIAAAGPDQRMLVTGDTDGVVKLWDLRRCTKSVCTVQYDGPVTELHANAALCLVCVSSRRGKDGLYVMDFSGDVPV